MWKFTKKIQLFLRNFCCFTLTQTLSIAEMCLFHFPTKCRSPVQATKDSFFPPTTENSDLCFKRFEISSRHTEAISCAFRTKTRGKIHQSIKNYFSVQRLQRFTSWRFASLTKNRRFHSDKNHCISENSLLSIYDSNFNPILTMGFSTFQFEIHWKRPC